jgi:hypothetical protein
MCVGGNQLTSDVDLFDEAHSFCVCNGLTDQLGTEIISTVLHFEGALGVLWYIIIDILTDVANLAE